MKYLLLLFLPFLACEEIDPNVYLVKKTEAKGVLLSGRGDDPLWGEANSLTNFSYPWREEAAPETEFRALWNEDYFFFRYNAQDPDIITQMDSSLSLEMQAVASDRVEIFFKSDDEMNPYYSLEMDALGRMYDSEGRYHRNIDSDWNWPEGGIQIYASLYKGGYILEGAISIKSLEMLGMKDGNILKAGLYRGEYVKEEEEIKVKWISWIMPDSETPDFHIPSSFGTIKLLE
ncbi:MAG: carbohydrate-binding family 9-like protein [Bacteroidia bacterium]|nr:carbohydrate-binding family 9-like protein [Bacteroidia bacterium]